MELIQKLVSRIRLDHEPGRGRFVIGHDGPLKQKIIRIPFEEIVYEEGNHSSVEIKGAEGEALLILFYRVREVYREGRLIWHRTKPDSQD